VKWSVVQSCFAGHATLSVFIVADAYGIYHLIDDITVDGNRDDGSEPFPPVVFPKSQGAR